MQAIISTISASAISASVTTSSASVTAIATSLPPVIIAPATVAPVAKPAKLRVKRAVKPVAAKPAPVAVKPATPGRKPDAARAKAIAERSAIVGANRLAVAAIYSGPSLAIRSAERVTAHSVYAALLASPKHRTTVAKLSIRDGSAAARIVANCDKAGTFAPGSFNLDCGNFSRLASVGYIIAAGERFKLSPDGVTFAKRAVALAKAA